MSIVLMLSIPLLLSLLPLVERRINTLAIINAAGYALVFGICALFANNFVASPLPIRMWGWLYADTLSVFFIFLTCTVSLAASLYSISYITAQVKEGEISVGKAAAYFSLFNLFCFVMLLVPLLNNLAFVWIAIEMTTLISAFLVGFHNTKESVEAAWKYIIICSVGIAFALLGIIFFTIPLSRTRE